MSQFLFYDDINIYLTESEAAAETPRNGQVEASIKAYWGKPTINTKYKPGSDEPKTIRKRLLNVQFFNVPAHMVDELDKYIGMKPNKEYPSEDGKTYNIVYNCKDIYSKGEKAAVAVRRAFEFFKQYGYRIPDIPSLMKNIPEEGKFEKIEQESNEKWLQILHELGNGETNELIERYIQIFSSMYEYVYGHKLSFRNAKLILAQKPNASLVLTERDWLVFFNCSVNPGAKPIYYEGMYSNRRNIENNYNLLKHNADARGIKYGREAQYTGHARLGMAIDSAETTNSCYVIGYDSSDVTPIDPNNDWRETKYGMRSNLTGEPNTATAEALKKMEPDEGNREQYDRIKSLINDNAKLFFMIFLRNLMKANPEMGRKFASLGNENKNPDYSELLPKVLRRLVDSMLEDEYKVKKPTDRAASRERITGEVLLLCGVWDANALKALKGGKVDRETLIHDSNIINTLMELLETGKNDVLKKLKDAIGELPKQDGTETQQPISENVSEIKTYCTPEKLAKDFNLEITGDPKNMSDGEFDYKNKTNMTNMFEMLDRMDRAAKRS